MSIFLMRPQHVFITFYQEIRLQACMGLLFQRWALEGPDNSTLKQNAPLYHVGSLLLQHANVGFLEAQ